jgi:hypothetical protein
MRLSKILVESLRLLASEPVFFIPRIITTAAYTLVTLYLASLTAAVMSGRMDPAPAFAGLLYILFFMGALYIFDFFTYAMYPKMVEDKKTKGVVSLKNAIYEASKSMGTILVLGFAVLAFATISSILLAPFLAYGMMAGNRAVMLFSGAIFFSAALVFSVLVFFVIPSAVISKNKAFDSFRESASLGFRHRLPVLKLNIFFAALAVATMYLVFMAELSGTTDMLSVIAFVISRLFQAVVYTYLSVVNPNAYLEARN